MAEIIYNCDMQKLTDYPRVKKPLILCSARDEKLILKYWNIKSVMEIVRNCKKFKLS